jgi:hypothetical protein
MRQKIFREIERTVNVEGARRENGKLLPIMADWTAGWSKILYLLFPDKEARPEDPSRHF